MSVFTATDENFATDVLGSETPVLIDFWAEWCGPCRMMAPVIESIATKYSQTLKVGKCDADVNQTVTAQNQITGLPCCILYKNGQELTRIVGFRSEDAIVDAIKEHVNI